MQKHLLLLLLIVPIYLSAQQTAEITQGTIHSASFNSGATWFQQSNDPGFFLTDPSNPSLGVSTIYNSSLWYVAVAQDLQTYVGAQTYGFDEDPNLKMDFGPLSGSYDTEYGEMYNRVWKVTSAEIQEHIDSWSDPGYTIPEAIASYPGNGRPGSGEWPTLAPFFDTNFNNLYEPELGDYPVIRGDVCVTWMVHDSEDGQLARAGIQMIHQAYMVESDSDAIESTLFFHTIIHNTNLNVYDLKVGLWADWDLGNPTDDYTGCDPLYNYFYAYNGDQVDEPNSFSQGFGENLAAQGAIFLSSPITSQVSYSNSPSPILGSPVIMFDYVNYINGLRKNGEPLPVFGDHPLPEYNNFMYYSSPSIPDSLWWTEMTQANVPGDRRSVAGSDQGTIQALERVCVDYAYVHSFKDLDLEIHELDILHDNMLEVQEYYSSQEYPCSENGVVTSVNDDLLSRWELNLCPNPAISEINLSSVDQVFYKIFSSTGQLVQQGQLQVGQNALQIDGLHPGIYTLTLGSGISSRFIKQ